MQAIDHNTEHPAPVPVAYWMPFSWKIRLPWQRYLLPMLGLAGACLLRVELLPFLGPRLPFVTFLPVILFAFLYSGVYPGLLATLLSVCYVTFFLGSSPDYILMIGDNTQRLVMSFSIMTCAMIAATAGLIYRAQKRTAEAELQAQIAWRQSVAEANLREAEARHQETMLALNAGLEQRVMERTAELEAAIREQETFSYSVSHDLRAPLRHINSFSAIVLEECGSQLPGEAQAYLARIRSATRRMGDFIDHLLELSRLSRAELVRESVDLSRLVAETLAMLQETEPHRRVELRIQEGTKAHGDRNLLGQLLENLLGNAWKYSSERALAVIEFGTGTVDGQEHFFVRDNGAGFDMAYSGKLFEVFQRLHGAEFEGAGIGLATAQRIVKRHGGTIWAEAEVDKGATFYFTLSPPEAARTVGQP